VRDAEAADPGRRGAFARRLSVNVALPVAACWRLYCVCCLACVVGGVLARHVPVLLLDAPLPAIDRVETLASDEAVDCLFFCSPSTTDRFVRRSTDDLSSLSFALIAADSLRDGTTGVWRVDERWSPSCATPARSSIARAAFELAVEAMVSARTP